MTFCVTFFHFICIHDDLFPSCQSSTAIGDRRLFYLLRHVLMVFLFNSPNCFMSPHLFLSFCLPLSRFHFICFLISPLRRITCHRHTRYRSFLPAHTFIKLTEMNGKMFSQFVIWWPHTQLLVRIIHLSRSLITSTHVIWWGSQSSGESYFLSITCSWLSVCSILSTVLPFPLSLSPKSQPSWHEAHSISFVSPRS